MKSLTNILSHLLMLLMLFIVACTEEAAEVDNLSRQEQYVTVRMNIPGMTATATRADDGVIESITALAFDDADKLLEIETITTVTNTNANDGFNGIFNLTVPNGTTTIHFLANLPDDATSQLPTEMGGSEVDVMTSLTTSDYNNLCYWGMTTTRDGNTNPLDVTLYRNLAKISIKPSITDTEFNQFEEEDLIIAGLINPNRVGKLVPYNNSFPQSIGELTYNTLPDNPNPLNRTPIGNEGAGYGNWLYVLEHENSNYEEYGLFVICKIGNYFYNVALTSDGVNPYPIIRNHEYIIYVSDVDDYQSEEYRSTNYSDMYDTNTSKILKTPINLEVKQKENTSLTLTSATNTLYYGDPSEEAVTVTVSGIVEGVESLTLTAPGFSVLTDYATLQDGKYILDDDVTEIDFTLILTDPAEAGTVSVAGEGEYVNITNPDPITITPTLREEVDGETVLWQGAVKMHVPNGDSKHAAKIPIPYSFFFDENNESKVPVGSIVRIESTGSNWLSADETKGDWTTIWSLNDNGQNLELTQDMLNTIRDNRNEVWGVDVAFVLQGGDGRVLNKVTLIPAKESIEANITNGATLYYDSDDTQVVTVNVTIPDGVETLNISAPDFIFDVENDGEYTYAVNSQTSATLSFTLKSGLSAKTSTITFSDANGGASPAAVSINLVKTPEVTFTQSANTINLNGYLDVTMNLTGTFNGNVSLTIRAPGFTVAAQNNVSLSNSGDVWTYNGSLTTLRFITTSVGEKTINIDGSGENVKVLENSFDVTVNAAIKAEATPSTIYYDGDNKDVTVSVTIPKGVSGLSISAPNFEYGEETGGSYTYTRNDGATTQTTVELTFTLNDGVKTDSSITFSDASSNPNVTGETVVIIVEKTPAQGAEQELWGSGEGEGSYTFSNNASWSLLGAGGSGGTLASDKELFKAGATLKVAFTTTSDGYPLELFTNWSREREFVEEYSSDGNSKYLIYKFVDDDFGGPGGTNDVTNAGLILVVGNATVTITKISIIPAPTTK